ncbi:MAG: tyrosine-type recombinase/integrase [Sciscionella sp.]
MSERIEDLAAAFRRHLRAANRAERTGVIYGQSITAFSAWLLAHGREVVAEEMTRAAIREWLAGLADVNSPQTVRTRFRGLFRFCRWCVDEGALAINPMVGMELPQAPPPVVPVLSDEQLSALVKACRGKRFYDKRDEAVIRFLLDTGVRVSELCGLTQEDMRLDEQMAIVTGKGSKVRPVYWGSRTGEALDRYLRLRRAHRKTDREAFWLGERGALTVDGAREILRVRSEMAGIGHVHPHQLRHTFAHDYLMAGGQQLDLKRLAGWTSDAMLSRYGASAADVRAREAARRLRRGDRI